jgi:DNA modification methylase
MFFFMDWRHLFELLTPARWPTIAVFKNGDTPHSNTFELGQRRSPSQQSLGVRPWQLHPTRKPVGLLADAIRDVSRRAAIVLDPFAGSGSSLIPAEITGQRAYLLETDPAYSDAIIRRFEAYTGNTGQLYGEDLSGAQPDCRRRAMSVR